MESAEEEAQETPERLSLAKVCEIMIIRAASIYDVPCLVEMGLRFRASVYADVVPENATQMRDTAWQLIIDDNSEIFVTEGRGGELTSMIGIQLYTHPISGERIAGEAFWWSDVPGHGIRVFHYAKEWARKSGALRMQMVQPMADAQLGDVYHRMGARCIEAAWEFDLREKEAVA